LARHRPRASRREPRAHWLLLLLGGLVLLAELSLNGFVRHVGAEGSGVPVVLRGPTPAPAEVTGGGPVVRIDASGAASSRSMPAGTIALTFDDGPDPEWTPKILDVLAKHHAHATFFVIGSRVNEYPELTRRILAEGNELGVHTFTHANLATLPSWRRRLELTLSLNAIAGATGQLPNLMRPPYSSEPDAITLPDYQALADAAQAGYVVVLTDHDTEDWRRPGTAAIVAAAIPKVGEGAVVMMHDSGGDRSQTLAAVDELLSKRSYRFTTVSAGLGLTEVGALGAADQCLAGQGNDHPGRHRAGAGPAAGAPATVERARACAPGGRAPPASAGLSRPGHDHRAGVQRGGQHRLNRTVTGRQRLSKYLCRCG
jgi:peptidoglycan/xylan/chitin deacetylase (PgdA/CDA1 family)